MNMKFLLNMSNFMVIGTLFSIIKKKLYLKIIFVDLSQVEF